MPRVLVSTALFRRAYHRLDTSQHALVDRALRQLDACLKTQRAPVGLGLKKLRPGMFEVRAGLALRVVCIEAGPQVFLALLGTHDDVRRFLRHQ